MYSLDAYYWDFSAIHLQWFCLYTAVIADSYVDREFGTGALKITPAHDPNDYLLAQRHNLPLMNIMHKDASINAAGGKYAGLSREQCRTQLWSDIVSAGLALTEYTSSKGPGTTPFCASFLLKFLRCSHYCYITCWKIAVMLSVTTRFSVYPLLRHSGRRRHVIVTLVSCTLT
jgi:hypothetical protein